MELFLSIVIIAFIAVVVVDIVQHRRQRTVRGKHSQISMSE